MFSIVDDIRIVRRWFNRRYQEWEAEGLVTVWGTDVRWRAFLPAATDRWEVEIPGGQNVPSCIVDEVVDAFEQLRTHLAATTGELGTEAA